MATLNAWRCSNSKRLSASRPVTPAWGLFILSQPAITVTIVVTVFAAMMIGPVCCAAKVIVTSPFPPIVPLLIDDNMTPSVDVTSEPLGIIVPANPLQTQSTRVGSATFL